MIKYITFIAFVSACAQVGGPKDSPEPPVDLPECEEPVVCEEPIKCEEWMPEECPEPEQCEECECPEPEQCPEPVECPEPPKFDPCSCVDFTAKTHVTEEEEACLGSMVENHGLCGKFDLKVWCEDPNRPDHWKPLRAWVRGCKLVRPTD